MDARAWPSDKGTIARGRPFLGGLMSPWMRLARAASWYHHLPPPETGSALGSVFYRVAAQRSA